MFTRITMMALTATIVALAVCQTGVTKADSSVATVPVQARFVNPPLYFGWDKLMTYHVKLVLTTGFNGSVYVEFLPYEETATAAKGGLAREIYRMYDLSASQPKIFTFRVMTPPAPISRSSIWYNWCLQIIVGVKGAAEQRTTTCALDSASTQ
jgi:hypothetical protein